MKKVAFLMLVALSAFSLISCGGEKSGKSEKKENVSASSSSSSVGYEESVFIGSGWAVFTEKDDGKMYAVLQVEAADTVYLIRKGNEFISKKAMRRFSNGEEKEYTFYQIKYNEKEYWTTDAYISNETVSTGMIYEDCRVFEKPDDSTMTKTQYKSGTYVVVSADRAEVRDYEKIIVYDGNRFGKAVWVPADCVTTSEGYIEGSRMRSKLSDDTDPKVRAEIEEMLLECER